MQNLDVLTSVSSRLADLTLPALIRPGGNSEYPSRQLVTWSILNYTYSTIAHYRTVLAGLVMLIKAENGPTAKVVCRHLYEWTMHVSYALKNFNAHLVNNDLAAAWEFFLLTNTSNGWVKKHGHKYGDDGVSDGIPDSIRLKHFVKAYEEFQMAEGLGDDVQDTYGYLSEYAHPSSACYLPYQTITGDVLSFTTPDMFHTASGTAVAACIAWLLLVYKLLSLAGEPEVRSTILHILQTLDTTRPTIAGAPAAQK